MSASDTAKNDSIQINSTNLSECPTNLLFIWQSYTGILVMHKIQL